ncbi:hypothetical protein [Amorphus sp. 3PC139-8]|uniref:hypothetical protein n=1 Tax=Amorphus sp. 3PC139-8 TaxID=2735676 RepID=UPI00345D7BFB
MTDYKFMPATMSEKLRDRFARELMEDKGGESAEGRADAAYNFLRGALADIVRTAPEGTYELVRFEGGADAAARVIEKLGLPGSAYMVSRAGYERIRVEQGYCKPFDLLPGFAVALYDNGRIEDFHECRGQYYTWNEFRIHHLEQEMERRAALDSGEIKKFNRYYEACRSAFHLLERASSVLECGCDPTENSALGDEAGAQRAALVTEINDMLANPPWGRATTADETDADNQSTC